MSRRARRSLLRVVPVSVLCIGGCTHSPAEPCERGTELCDCFGNGTCFAPLICASNLCVEDPRLAGGAGGGNVGDGGLPESPEPLGMPCEPCTNTDLCLMPSSLECGGNDCVGVGAQTYCTHECSSDADCTQAPEEMRCLARCESGFAAALPFVGRCLVLRDFELLGEGFCAP